MVITAVRIASPAGNQRRTSAEASSTTSIDGTSLTGTYGTLTLNADGSYSYEADQDTCDSLDPSDIAIDRFIYTLSDGSSTADAQLSIAIIGRNDAPRFDQQIAQATITERPGSSETTSSNLSGTFSANDPDADSSSPTTLQPSTTTRRHASEPTPPTARTTPTTTQQPSAPTALFPSMPLQAITPTHQT